MIAVLERVFPRRPADVHRTRFARQEADEGTYLLAVSEARPVGFVFLSWTGCRDDFLRGRIDTAAIPHLEDLLVADDARRRGVAGRILTTAEDLARERGFDRIGVNVSLENDPARALYEARGFEDAGIDSYEIGDRGVRKTLSLYEDVHAELGDLADELGVSLTVAAEALIRYGIAEARKTDG